jgi:hypothetical protein
MWYPDETQRLEALADSLSRRILCWMSCHLTRAQD